MGNRLFSPGWQVVATSVLNQLEHKSDLRMPTTVHVLLLICFKSTTEAHVCEENHTLSLVLLQPQLLIAITNRLHLCYVCFTAGPILLSSRKLFKHCLKLYLEKNHQSPSYSRCFINIPRRQEAWIGYGFVTHLKSL